MFGKGKQIERLMGRNNWDKVNQIMAKADKALKLDAARACANHRSMESLNLLQVLMMDDDTDVQLESIRAMEVVGNDSSVSRLRWLLGRLTEEQGELREAANKAIAAIVKRK